jgi:hypothetical protein
VRRASAVIDDCGDLIFTERERPAPGASVVVVAEKDLDALEAQVGRLQEALRARDASPRPRRKPPGRRR